VVSTEGLDGQEQYAMKVVEKKKLNESMLAAADAEQGIMSAIKKMEHPCILKAFFSFFARKYFRLEHHSNPIFSDPKILSVPHPPVCSEGSSVLHGIPISPSTRSHVLSSVRNDYII